MNQASTIRTMPSATNLRTGILQDYQRLFNLVSIAGIKTGSANWETLEVAALAIRNSPGSIVNGCLFDIPTSELDSYFEREHRYKRLSVMAYDPSCQCDISCWTVVENSDEDYKNSMDKEEFDRRIRQYYDGQLWGRSDILPMRDYAAMSVIAAYRLGAEEWLRNILEETILSSGNCTLLEHIMGNRERFESIFDSCPLKELYPDLLLPKVLAGDSS